PVDEDLLLCGEGDAAAGAQGLVGEGGPRGDGGPTDPRLRRVGRSCSVAAGLVEAPDGLEPEGLGAALDRLFRRRHADAELERATLVGEERVDGLLTTHAVEVRMDSHALVEVDPRPASRVVDG